MTPAQTAAAEFRVLLGSAPRAIAAGKVTRDEAEDKLQCWLAIAATACAGMPDEPVEIPELERLLPHYRAAMVYRPRRGWREETFAEGEARQRCALAIRPRDAWAPHLAKALGKALAHAPDAHRTVALAELAAMLGVAPPRPASVETKRKAA